MLQTLLLRNFRNYTEQILSFSPKKNLIFGENAQGKTNLIEALSLITTGRSNRTPYLSECIHHSKPYFYLEAHFFINDIEMVIKLYYDKVKRSLSINGNSYNTFSPLIGLHPSVIHTPNDLLLISSTPSLRRKLFDLHISSHDKEYLNQLIRYYRAKKQRDQLLKTKVVDAIECFEEEMAKCSDILYEKRKQMIQELQPIFSSYAQKLILDKNLKISYQPSTENILLELLKKNRPKELILGNTLQGPHRDDFTFSIEDKLAKSFASEGQKRACVLALRLAEYQRLKNNNSSILFCIDDMATHFDPERQKSLKQVLKDLDQVFITLSDPNTKLDIADKTFFVKEGLIHDS